MRARWVVVPCFALLTMLACGDEEKTPTVKPVLTNGCHAYCIADAYNFDADRIACLDETSTVCGTAVCPDGGPPTLDRCSGQTALCPDGAVPVCNTR